MGWNSIEVFGFLIVFDANFRDDFDLPFRDKENLNHIFQVFGWKN